MTTPGTITTTIPQPLLDKAITIGENRDRMNHRYGMAHKRNFHQRMAQMGDFGAFWHIRGCIGEAAVLHLLTTVADTVGVPQPVWTGGHAYTKEEMAIHKGEPDITWLGIDIEVKTVEGLNNAPGVFADDVKKHRLLILTAPTPLKPCETPDWSNDVLVFGTYALERLLVRDKTGERLWMKLPIPFYSNEKRPSRQLPQSWLDDPTEWANDVATRWNARHLSSVAA